jgi:hypothetical protein
MFYAKAPAGENARFVPCAFYKNPDEGYNTTTGRDVDGKHDEMRKSGTIACLN